MNRTITIAPVRKSIVVQATPQRAFEVFTAGIDRWWPKTHGIGEAPVKEPGRIDQLVWTRAHSLVNSYGAGQQRHSEL